ncbi:MAG: exodeoxyribonuclease VII large subunit [Paludibacter sp.]|jgi:exodeoxyribonuclease VII large subunit|nr:exodeoxyribonuclease VII large subunit [Paludibacter sp.]
MQSISLSELSERVTDVIKMNFDSPLWLRAEISELREAANGHCYLELIEKSAGTDEIIAKTKATVWANVYRMLKPYFESSTGETLRAGLKTLVAVTVEFHGVYGFSVNIRDIDPVFTVGEMEARRRQIIRRLEDEGVAEMNRLLAFPALPQRVAIISSPVAAGFGDFMHQIENNAAKYRFYTKLFPAAMQGERAASSIIAALEQIYAHAELFDVVLIIRGGGATADLSCFDSYELAVNCAQFPLPIVAGIGHQRDVSILDFVAHTSVKTPTATAELLLASMEEAELAATELIQQIAQNVKQVFNRQEQFIVNIKWKIKQSLRNKLSVKTIDYERKCNRLKAVLRRRFLEQQNKLALVERSIEAHSPAFLLKHGYTITAFNGKRLFSAKDATRGAKIKTFFVDGEISSIVGA